MLGMGGGTRKRGRPRARWLSYFGHIMRRENSLEKSIMLGMGGGTRKRGRPRARWLSYFGHIMRRENSLEKSIMLGMGGGTRKRGRQRARWLDGIKAITNCALTELCGSARDRHAWRKMIIAITRSWTRLDWTR